MKKISVALPKRLLIFGLVYIVLQLLVLPLALTWGNWLLGSPLSATSLNFVFFALNFLVITVAYRDFLGKNFKALLHNPWRVLRFAGAGLMLYWIATFVVGFIITSIYPNFMNANDMSISQMTKENYTLMSIGTVLLVPVVEETLYRGVVFGGIYTKSPVLAYIVSTAVFSIIHILGYITVYTPLELLLSFIQYLPAGICLAWSYKKADSIWAPILIHIAVNQVGTYSMR